MDPIHLVRVNVDGAQPRLTVLRRGAGARSGGDASIHRATRNPSVNDGRGVPGLIRPAQTTNSRFVWRRDTTSRAVEGVPGTLVLHCGGDENGSENFKRAAQRDRRIRDRAITHVFAVQDLFEHILGYLSGSDLKSTALVCRQWNAMISPTSWKHAYFNLIADTFYSSENLSAEGNYGHPATFDSLTPHEIKALTRSPMIERSEARLVLASTKGMAFGDKWRSSYAGVLRDWRRVSIRRNELTMRPWQVWYLEFDGLFHEHGEAYFYDDDTCFFGGWTSWGFTLKDVFVDKFELESSRTRTGGWMLRNDFVILLSTYGERQAISSVPMDVECGEVSICHELYNRHFMSPSLKRLMTRQYTTMAFSRMPDSLIAPFYHIIFNQPWKHASTLVVKFLPRLKLLAELSAFTGSWEAFKMIVTHPVEGTNLLSPRAMRVLTNWFDKAKPCSGTSFTVFLSYVIEHVSGFTKGIDMLDVRHYLSLLQSKCEHYYGYNTIVHMLIQDASHNDEVEFRSFLAVWIDRSANYASVFRREVRNALTHLRMNEANDVRRYFEDQFVLHYADLVNSTLVSKPGSHLQRAKSGIRHIRCVIRNSKKSDHFCCFVTAIYNEDSYATVNLYHTSASSHVSTIPQTVLPPNPPKAKLCITECIVPEMWCFSCTLPHGDKRRMVPGWMAGVHYLAVRERGTIVYRKRQSVEAIKSIMLGKQTPSWVGDTELSDLVRRAWINF